VLSLDIGVADRRGQYRAAAQFEERLKAVLLRDPVLDGHIILFIDGCIPGPSPAKRLRHGPSNLLKPALSLVERIGVGATTLDEYRKHVEKDAAWRGRFQPIFPSSRAPRSRHHLQFCAC